MLPALGCSGGCIIVEIVTYENLYEILREEKQKKELQAIDKNFYKNMVKYLKEKQKMIDAQQGKDSLFSAEIKRTQKQVENVRKMLRELYERREYKIMQLAMFSSRSGLKEDTSNMLAEERKLFAGLLEESSRYRKGILDNMLLLQLPKVDDEEKTKELKRAEHQEKENKLVRFIHPVPKFVGMDMNVYGPFEAEDISLLPKNIAEVLTRKSRAEEIQSEN